ncbi:hypothetical protein J0E37_000645 [Campylobacter upsaliensis]|nr:hypothetical protein [Campylobacter upsaliensis]
MMAVAKALFENGTKGIVVAGSGAGSTKRSFKRALRLKVLSCSRWCSERS